MQQKSLLLSVQAILNQATASHEIAGINLLVLHHNKEVLYAQSGYADISRGLPITKDTIFRLYSMTKPITAAAIMLLMERGTIDLYDPVELYLPGFHNQMVAEGNALVPAKRQTTIHDLLSMTSGLSYDGTDTAGQAASNVIEQLKSRMDSPHPIDTVTFANLLGCQPISFHPGEHFMYGTSADILGAIVEVVSGTRFGAFLKKEFFDPLGMADTGFYVPSDKQIRLSRTYEHRIDGSIHEFPTNHLGISYRMEKDPAYEAGGAGLASTLPDYARFASMLLNHGTLDGITILKPETVKFMTTGKLLPWQQEDLWRGWNGLLGYSYGNLMRVMEYPGMAGMISTPGEYGWDGWLGPYFSNHPDRELTILLGMQKRDAGTTALTRRLRNLVLSSL